MKGLLWRIDLLSRRAGAFRSIKMGDNSEISGCHLPFVISICRHPGMTQDQLAKHLTFNKSTVARAIGSLEEQGFVKRQADERDRRSLLVYPTQKMLDILPRVLEITREWNEGLCEGISDEELEIFASVLEKMKLRSLELLEGAEERK